MHIARTLADAGDVNALLRLEKLFTGSVAARGDLDEAMHIARTRVDAGHGDATRLAALLTQQGRRERSEAIAPVRPEPGRVNCLKVKDFMPRTCRGSERQGGPEQGNQSSSPATQLLGGPASAARGGEVGLKTDKRFPAHRVIRGNGALPLIKPGSFPAGRPTSGGVTPTHCL